MAGRGAGVSAFAWRWCADVVPPAPPKRGRGMPHAPLRKIWTTWLEVWLPGCRWGASPGGPQGASTRATHRWRQRWPAEGTVAAMPARMVGVAEARGRRRGAYGAVDGALSPGAGWRRGRRPRRAGHGPPPPQPHRGERDAVSAPSHASPRGGARPGGARAGRGQGPHGPTGASPPTPQGHGDGARRGCPRAAATAPATGAPGAAAAARLADQEKSWQTAQKSGATMPRGADVRLVPEEIAPCGGPVGAPCGLLRRVSGDRHDPYWDP